MREFSSLLPPPSPADPSGDWFKYPFVGISLTPPFPPFSPRREMTHMSPENWIPTEAYDKDAPESGNESQEAAPSLSDSSPEEAAPVGGDQLAKPPSPEEPAAPMEIAGKGDVPEPCEPHREEIDRMLDEIAHEEADRKSVV